MFRLLRIIIGFLIITVAFRWVMSFLKRAVSDESQTASTGNRASERAQAASAGRDGGVPAQAGNELKRCAACGVYSPVSTALSAKSAQGEMIYYCSEKCRIGNAA